MQVIYAGQRGKMWCKFMAGAKCIVISAPFSFLLLMPCIVLQVDNVRYTRTTSVVGEITCGYLFRCLASPWGGPEQGGPSGAWPQVRCATCAAYL